MFKLSIQYFAVLWLVLGMPYQNALAADNKNQKITLKKKPVLAKSEIRWEYKWVAIKLKRGFHNHYIKTLNKLGDQGWELVQFFQSKKYMISVLKRRHR